MNRLVVSPFRGSRSPVVSVAAILLSIKIAPGLFVTAAEGEALSASAERYATCVEQEATSSARAHVRDPEVLGSAVPEKALSILVNNDLALQLHFFSISESMGHHDSEIMDDRGIDRGDA
jgi:hypothetical protein